METSFNPNKMDENALSENITGEDKSASISVSVNAKLKALMEEKFSMKRKDTPFCRRYNYIYI